MNVLYPHALTANAVFFAAMRRAFFGFALLPLLLALFPGVLPAAESPPETVFREIFWEDLLPEELRGEAFSSEGSSGGKELEIFLEKREKVPANSALQGKEVKIYGFVVPLERAGKSLKEFLLVPYFGACIHVPPPPQNQVISVTLQQPAEDVKAMDTVWVYGKLDIENVLSTKGEAAYALKAVKLERETTTSKYQTALSVVLTLFCGMSICLGWVGPFAAVRPSQGLLCFGVAFAGGMMTCLGLSTVALGLSIQSAGAFMLGAFLVLVMDFVFHGTECHAGKRAQLPTGFGAAFAVALHNFPECFLVFSSTMASNGLGLALGGAMLAHNIPLGISIGLSSGRKSRQNRGWAYAALAGATPALAAIMAYFCLRSLFTPQTVRILFAGAGGALVSYAMAKLAPFARRQGEPSTVAAGFATGVLLLLVILIFSFRGY